MAAVVAASAKGLYASPDSVFYVGTARNLLDGVGFRPPGALQPLGHFPPLFTLVIAAVGWLGLDPLDAGRAVNVPAVAEQRLGEVAVRGRPRLVEQEPLLEAEPRYTVHADLGQMRLEVDERRRETPDGVGEIGRELGRGRL